MEFMIISGLSGAGKSRTADIFEDFSYYCVDNMPVMLIPRFAELCLSMQSRYEKVALVTDVRERHYSTEELFAALDSLKKLNCDYRILFVEADTETIVKRYKETRRPHPLAAESDSIEDAVNRERLILQPIKERADYVINTSDYSANTLQNVLYSLILGGKLERRLTVNLISFGFKYGIPMEADLVFDVRFLINPYYVPELKELSGLDSPVRDYVMNSEGAAQFMARLLPLIEFLLPRYVEEGKHSLTIAVGCTGGQHRSVAVCAEIAEFIKARGHEARLTNRDISKG